jgi:hypothetical protein
MAKPKARWTHTSINTFILEGNDGDHRAFTILCQYPSGRWHVSAAQTKRGKLYSDMTFKWEEYEKQPCFFVDPREAMAAAETMKSFEMFDIVPFNWKAFEERRRGYGR